MLAGDGEVFGRKAAAEGVAGVHGAGTIVPAVAVGGGFEHRREWLEGGELEKKVAVGGEGVGEVEGAGFFEEALADGAGIQHGLPEGDVFDAEHLVGLSEAAPAGLPEIFPGLAHGFRRAGENLGGGIFFDGGAVGGESAFGEPVIGLQKNEPFAPGKEGASIHGVVKPSVAPAVDGEVRKRMGDLERPVG